MSDSENIRVIIKSSGIPREVDADEYCWNCSSISNTVSAISEKMEIVEAETATFDYVMDEASTSEDLYQQCLSDLGTKVTNGIKCFLLGIGETSCDIDTFFQGSTSAKGLITLSVSDILHQVHQNPDRIFLLRVSVIEIIKETARDLLEDRPPKVEFADQNESFIISSSENEFSSLDEFKSIVIDGLTRKNRAGLEDSVYNANRTLVLRICCESRVRDDAIYRSNGEVLRGELNLILLPGIETLRLDDKPDETPKEMAILNKGITSLYRVISSLSAQSTPESSINWRNTKVLHYLHHALLPSSFTCVVGLLYPTLSHESVSYSTLLFSHRIRKIRQTPAPHRVMNKGVVVKFLKEQLKSVEEDLQKKETALQDVKEQLMIKSEAFETVSMALDQANEQLGVVNAQALAQLSQDKQALQEESDKQKEVISQLTQHVEKQTGAFEKLKCEKEEMERVMKARMEELENQLRQKETVISELSSRGTDEATAFKQKYEEVQSKYSLQTLRMNSLEKQLAVIRSSHENNQRESLDLQSRLSVVEGELKEQQEHADDLEVQLKDKDQQILALKDLDNKFIQLKEQMQANLKKADEEKSEYKAEIQSIRSSYEQLQTELMRKEMACETLAATLALYESTYKQMKEGNASSNHSELEKTVALKDQEMEELQAKQAIYQEQIQSLQSTLQVIEEKYKNVSSLVTELKDEKLQMQEQISRLRMEIEIVEAEKKGIEQSMLQEHENRKEHENEELKQLQIVLATSNKKVEELSKKIEECEALNIRIQSENHDLASQLGKSVADTTSLNEKNEQLQQQLREGEEKRLNAEKEFNSMKERNEEELQNAQKLLSTAVAKNSALEKMVSLLRDSLKSKDVGVSNLKTQLQSAVDGEKLKEEQLVKEKEHSAELEEQNAQLLKELEQIPKWRQQMKEVLDSIQEKEEALDRMENMYNEMVEKERSAGKQLSEEMSKSVMLQQELSELKEAREKDFVSQSSREESLKKQLSEEMSKSVMLQQELSELKEAREKDLVSQSSREESLKKQLSEEMSKSVMLQQELSELKEAREKDFVSQSSREESLKKQLSEEMSKTSTLQQELNELKETREKDLVSQSSREESLKKQLTEEMNKTSTLQQQIDLEIQSHHKELAESSSREEALLIQLNREKAERHSLEDSLKQTETRMSELKRKNDELADDKEEVQLALQQLKQQLQLAEQESRNAEEAKKSALFNLSSCEHEVSQLRELVSKHSETIGIQERQLSEYLESIEVLTKQKNHLNQEVQSIQTEFKAFKQETALQLQNESNEKNRASLQIEQLKQRESELMKEKDSEVERRKSEVNDLMEKVNTYEGMIEMMKTSEEEHQSMQVELTKAMDTVASLKKDLEKKQKMLLTRDDMITALEKEQKAHQLKEEEVKKGLINQVTLLTVRISELENAAEQAEVRAMEGNTVKERELQVKVDEIVELKKRIIDLEKQMKAKEAKNLELNEQLEKTQRLHEEERSKRESQMEEIRLESSEVRKELDEMNRKSSVVEVELQSLKEENKKRESDYLNLREELTSKETALKHIVEEKTRLSNEVIEGKAKRESLEKNVKEQEARIKELMKNRITGTQLEKIREIVNEKKELKKKLKVAEAEIQRLKGGAKESVKTFVAEPEKTPANELKKSLPRNTHRNKVNEDETVRIVEHLNEIKSRTKNLNLPELPDSLQSPSISDRKRNRPVEDKPEVSDKREKAETSEKKDDSCHVN